MAKKLSLKYSPKNIIISLLILVIIVLGLIVATKLVESPQYLESEAAPGSRGTYTANFAPLGKPDASWDTAAEFIRTLNKKHIGGGVKMVYTYYQAQPITVAGDHPIEAGKGYLIDFYSSPGNLARHFKNYTPVSSQAYTLPISLDNYFGLDFGNLISIPQGVMSQLGKMKAEGLCKTLKNKGIAVTKIATTYKAVFLKTHLYTENIVFHTCGTQDNNFSISAGMGYFVYVSQSGSVVLP